jgi:hypothetical protein
MYNKNNYNEATHSKKERRRVKKMREARNGFFIHLIVYLFINGINLIEFLEGDSSARGWYSMALFWGIGLFFHYVKVFGSPQSEIRSLEGAQSRALRPESPDENLELRPLQKAWSDKDLV